MTAMEIIDEICSYTDLREQINSKIKKYLDKDFYGFHFVLEYQHQPCEKRYRIEYRIPFDAPCLLEFWPVEEADKYFDEQENKARKELIDRVINDINKGDVETMPYKNFIIDMRDVCCKPPKIVKIETYNDRVVKVTFADGTFTKAVCAVNDIFDIDVGITVCVMKKMLGKDGGKIYNNMIRDCHKLMNEQENKKIEMKTLKEEIKNKQRKDEEKRKAGKQKAREEQIEIQKEAFIRAMQETGMVNNGR